MTAGRRIALVTGGAGAIGAAAARMLAADGFSIVLADMAADAANDIAERLRNELAAEVVVEPADLSDLSSLAPMVARIGDRFGRLDCLVNNAGRTGASTIGELDPVEWDSILTLNLTVPMLLSQEALALMRRAGGGSIVNVASRVYLSGTGIGYTSSKAGLIGLTRAMAVQLGKYRVRVNAVAPSFLNSPFNTGIVEKNRGLAEAFVRLSPLRRLGTPEDVAGAIAFLASDRAAFITGDVLHVCGGTQLAPQPD
jgi:NAD(P)-dependent dehydrogenase (short-subunit alcohol dehydrogenase family)